MTRAVLTTAEARAAADRTLTKIRRPFPEAVHRGHAAEFMFRDGAGTGFVAWFGADPPSTEVVASLCPGNRGVAPPLGQPGTVLDVAEDWGAGSRSDPFEGSVDGIEYRADEEGLDDDDMLPMHKAPEGVDLCEYMGKGWQPAAAMPPWAVRSRLRITAVRVERAGEGWEWIYGVEKAS